MLKQRDGIFPLNTMGTSGMMEASAEHHTKRSQTPNESARRRSVCHALVCFMEASAQTAAVNTGLVCVLPHPVTLNERMNVDLTFLLRLLLLLLS